MNHLAQAIADRIVAHVKGQVANLQGGAAEFRAVFNGPPGDILETLYTLLTLNGGIETTLGNGDVVNIPVVMQVDQLPGNVKNPPVGVSGLCDVNHLLDLRNSPNCPRFIGLVPPGHQANLSQTSTRSDFGLAAKNNSGTSDISDWWNDKFIQGLIEGALENHNCSVKDQLEDARKLVELAIFAANEVDKHGTARRGEWLVLSRLWSLLDNKSLPFGSLVSLACGYPPCDDGSLDAEVQIQVLRTLSSRLEENGFRPAIDQIKQHAESDAEKFALGEVLQHLQRKCSVQTALARSMPHYYGPFIAEAIDAPPEWWQILTVEKWIKLLEEDDTRRGAIKLECLNSIMSQIQGLVPVVTSAVKLRITIPEDVMAGTNVTITRDVAGASNHREWTIAVNQIGEIEDNDIPSHKTPARYSAVAEGFKKGSLRVISLGTWAPGFIVGSRAATKGIVPKPPRNSREKIAYETSLVLNGVGRHYLDVYVKPGIRLAESAYGSNEHGQEDKNIYAPISRVSDSEYGFEIETTSEGFYQFEVFREGNENGDVVRINLACDEVTPEKCGSEFERLIRLNRQREGRATTDVHVNRQLRCSVLQSWMLDKVRVAHTFYPLVLAPDYAQDWRARDWTSAQDTVFSQGRFLNDPRPSPEEMRPPEAFIRLRKEIAKQIRGGDENGLVEAARLGEWLASDGEFCEMVEGYVRAYLEWLEAAPDIAAWCDIAIITRFEPDETTLIQEPEAILVSPIHPIRLAWHCLAQRALFLAQKKSPCPAASILDPDCIPDALVLPLRTAAGGIRRQVFFSVECSSDYWSILWNGAKLDRLAAVVGGPPFDQEFGVLVGGISSGFSVSQVHRALDDVSEMLVAKPVINVLVSSAAGQNNACNEGLISWCKEHFTVQDRERPVLTSLGARFIQILDERKAAARPEDAEISNLGEDTGNSVRWYVGSDRGMTPDLGIIAQLETSNAGFEEIKIGSPLAVGGLIRTRVRQQLKAAAGAFLCETRMGLARPSSGDGLADKTVAALVRLENLAEVRYGYSFAPSIHAIQTVLQKADYAAVSSSAVDPACFLGGWLGETYLWDYDLPSYSNRSGDSNGYYLLSKIKGIDRETLSLVLSRLPECQNLPELMLDDIILEVARRGIPTIRGLSSGSSGASGDLGLFVAARLFQDEFRLSKNNQSLLPIWTEVDGLAQIVLVIPVDPFRGYLEDLTRAISKQSHQRPDLIVVAIHLSDSQIRCKLTPVEVKYRNSKDTMSDGARLDALQQAKSLSTLLGELGKRSNESELALWKIAFQHLLISMLNFGFRVYSQQPVVSNQAERWSDHHARLVEAIYSDELNFEVDSQGRLIVIDGSKQSAPFDHDNDGFSETIVLSHGDASEIVKGDAQGVYDAIKARVKDWNLFPAHCENSDLAQVHSDAHVESAGKSEDTVVLTQNLIKGSVNSHEDEERPITGFNGNVPTAITASKAETIIPENVAVSTGVDLLIGNTVDGFHEEVRRLNLSDTNLNQLNIGVVGDLGTGKTQLLKSLIYQITQNAASNQGIKPNILIFDYKKDYSSDEFVKSVGARVVKPWRLPINLFDVSAAGESMTPWLERFKFFSDVLDKIFSGVGPVQRAQLKNAVRQAYSTCEAEGRQPNIYDVHSNYHSIVSKADSVSSIIDDLVDMEIFSPEPTSASSVDNFLDGIVVISLDALGQDDRTKNMLVAIMLNIFYEHMLRIPKRPYVGVDQKLRVVDSFLLVDEADNIMRYEFDILRKILLQGREFGVGVILASQYLRHFKAGATDYREPLLTWFIHKVPNVTPQELAALGLIGNVTQLSERIKSLLLHECLFKTFNISGDIIKGLPFYKLLKKD